MGPESIYVVLLISLLHLCLISSYVYFTQIQKKLSPEQKKFEIKPPPVWGRHFLFSVTGHSGRTSLCYVWARFGRAERLFSTKDDDMPRNSAAGWPTSKANSW